MMSPTSGIVGRTLSGRRRLVVAAVLLIGLTAVLLFMLSTATANGQRFANHHRLLLFLNIGLVVVFGTVIGLQLWALRRRIRSGVFGSRLSFRLAVFFSLVALLPGALVYVVSVQFTSRSIESWFDVRIDKALEGGLALGRSALEGSLRELVSRAEVMASSLADRGDAQQRVALETLREQNRFDEVELYSSRGTLIGSAGQESGISPELPVSAVMRQIRLQQPFSSIEALPDGRLFLRAVVAVNTLSLADDIRALQVLQQVPPAVAAAADTVQVGYRDYQELLLSRTGLRQLYGLTLTLTLLIGLLVAVALAFFLSEQLASPLGILAEGTAAVARGDFRPRETVTSGDELGLLTGSFNTMIRQLDDARAANERGRAQIEAARAYLESVLGNLSSGVMSFDGNLRLRAANRSATDILGIEMGSLLGSSLSRHAEGDSPVAQLGAELAARFGQTAAGGGTQTWESQFEYLRGGGSRTLLLRGALLQPEPGGDAGCVVVFDDITNLMRAQRDAAWAEVARRLAHEIKNPLTPIQLAAERIHHKLAERLSAPDAQMLERSTRTIVNQVAAMKSMVDAFAEYARNQPEPVTGELDLDALVREVLGLYEATQGPVSFETRLAGGLPRIAGSQTQLRQVLHNLLQNAQDSLAGVEHARVTVCTEAVPAAAGQRAWVRLTVTDNGAGFPPAMLARVFEPYVTTKAKGTGLGLAIVKKIIDEHHGHIEVVNVEPAGARVDIRLPVAVRADAQAAA